MNNKLSRAFQEIENLRSRIKDLESKVKRLECDHPGMFIEYITAAPNILGQHHRKCNLCGKSLGLVKLAEVVEDNG